MLASAVLPDLERYALEQIAISGVRDLMDENDGGGGEPDA